MSSKLSPFSNITACSTDTEEMKKPHTSTSDERILQEQGYHLLKKVGEGSYARVYLGEFTKNDGDIFKLACRIVNTRHSPPHYVQKFLVRELKILTKIKHPHIIHVYSVFQRKASYFIFMRYAERGDLFEYITKHGMVKENLGRIWTRQIALALQYLHTLEIAHRDLKCENILVTNQMNVKLADFGFARYLIDDHGQAEMSSTFCGSRQYLAPEVLNGEPYNPKVADIWSLGVVIYTMLNQALPFRERENRLLYAAQIQKRWQFRDICKNLSKEVRLLVESLLEPTVEKRPKIGDVVSSKWIAMDSRLRALNSFEMRALYSAMNERNSMGESNKRQGKRSSLPPKKASKDLIYWKRMSAGLDIERSLMNKFDDIILL